MPFSIDLQHHPAATFHSRGGISVPTQRWNHRALCNEQMSSFYTISPTPSWVWDDAEDILQAKCSAKQGCIPVGMQVPKQLPSKPAKAEALKARLISDTSLARIQPPLEHQLPYLKIRTNGASHFATCCCTHPAAAWWEFWYKGRYNTQIQWLSDLFQWSMFGQEPCLIFCNQPSQASLISFCHIIFCKSYHHLSL